MAPNGSPSRNTCSPGCSGPTCSTSTCRPISAALSMPSDMQAWEKAQVAQKVSASPSSAITAGPLRGKTTPGPLMRAPSRGSDGARVQGGGAPGGGEVAVEAHGDDTQQQASARRGLQAGFAQLDQAVCLQRLQAGQRIGEVAAEIDDVTAAEDVVVQAAMAHQLLDHVGADHVVLVHAHATPHRQAALVDRLLPAADIARVLAEAGADVADRAHAQADQVALRMGGVAHEVAVQAAFALRARQLVGRQGEVVHADVLVAG